MLRDHGVVLAIETHFEFTSFELCRLIEMCEAEPGGWLGICLDTMNLLTMIEHPVWATERLLPWVVSTHIKDGGVLMGRRRAHDVSRADRRGHHRSGRDHPAARHAAVAGATSRSRITPAASCCRFTTRRSSAASRICAGPSSSALVDLSERTAGLPACRPVERSAWPSICEARMAGDLDALRTLAERTPDGRGGA